VAEADESDASFLHLQPMVAVVTNIDADHLGSYENDLGRLKQGFVEFLHNLPFYGLAVLCSDDANTRELIPSLGRRVVSYGFGERADIRASAVQRLGLKTRFTVETKERSAPLTVELNLPGMHNVLNSLAAIAVATELEIAEAPLLKALAEFSGVDRRLQVHGTVTTAAGRVTFVDDYGHHPTELAATIAAARDAWPGRRLVVCFQPHRYTRTLALIDDFAQVLSTVDALILTNVYSAGENPLAGADGKSLARAVRVRGAVEPIFIEDLNELPAVLGQIMRADDVVLTLGAGSIGAVAPTLPRVLTARTPIGVQR
jgi:UDP-N-acetylmuramate--alanine ligase